jgi:hypothetical protein
MKRGDTQSNGPMPWFSSADSVEPTKPATGRCKWANPCFLSLTRLVRSAPLGDAYKFYFATLQDWARNPASRFLTKDSGISATQPQASSPTSFVCSSWM